MKLSVSACALRCAALVTWVFWHPLDATGVGLGAGGSFSVGRCSLEMVQLEKRDGVQRLCTSLAQLYAQLGESQKGEKRWIAKAQDSQMRLTKESGSLRGQVTTLQHELAEAKNAYAQNEKLELSVEELHELYDHQRIHSKQNDEENQQLKLQLAQVESRSSNELKQGREAMKTLSNVTRANAALHHNVNQETKLLKNLQHREDLEIAEIKQDRQALLKATSHDNQLQKLISQYSLEMAKLRRQLYESAQEQQRLKQENAILRQSIGTAEEQAQGTAYLQQQVKMLSSNLEKSNQLEQSCQAQVEAAESDMNKALKKSAVACEKRVAQTLQDCASKV